jgi:hypothetical protein
MGRIGKERGQICVNVPNALKNRIAERAAMIRLSNSAYVADLLQWWIDQGEPPVNQLDRVMRVAARQETLLQAAEDRAEYGKKPGSK